MTIEDVEKLVSGKRIARHRGDVFFTTYDPEEAATFRGAGANAVSYTIRGVTYWEIQLASMLDPMPSDPEPDEEPRDLRREFILDYFRARDGYELPVHLPVGERT